MVKLDIRRAFDSLSRIRLARRIKEWCSHKPYEAASLIALLGTSTLEIHLPWNTVAISASQGVRQGAPESPMLVAKVMECVLEETNYPRGLVFDDLDALLWKGSVPHMQAFLNDLLPRLAAEGLHIQPPKCQLMTFGEVGGTHLQLQGFQLKPVAEDEPLILMNAPNHPII